MADAIRVIVYREADLWVAQCLEHDIGAQAADLDTLRLRLEVTLDAEMGESLERGGEPFGGIEAAPARFHEMWERRARSFEGDVEVSANGRPVHVDMALAA